MLFPLTIVILILRERNATKHTLWQKTHIPQKRKAKKGLQSLFTMHFFVCHKAETQ